MEASDTEKRRLDIETVLSRRVQEKGEDAALLSVLGASIVERVGPDERVVVLLLVLRRPHHGADAREGRPSRAELEPWLSTREAVATDTGNAEGDGAKLPPSPRAQEGGKNGMGGGG